MKASIHFVRNGKMLKNLLLLMASAWFLKLSALNSSYALVWLTFKV